MENTHQPIVDAFEYRWTLAQRGAEVSFSLTEIDGLPWEQGTTTAAETLIERTEMRMGLRCADCGLRFHLAGADPDRHSSCIPF